MVVEVGSLAGEASGERAQRAMPLAKWLKAALHDAGLQVEAVPFDFPRNWESFRLVYDVGDEAAACKRFVRSIGEHFTGDGGNLRSLIQGWNPAEDWEPVDAWDQVSALTTLTTGGLAVSDHALARTGVQLRRLLCAYVMSEAEFTTPSGAVSEEFQDDPPDEAG